MKFLTLLTLLLTLLTACSPALGTPAAVVSTATAQATVTPKPTLPPTATPNAAEVTADSLHVRNKPMGLRIGYLRHANTVTLTGRCRTGWAQIEWEDATAWVKASFLSKNICQTNKE
jgi:hypothetical protein